MDEKHKEHYLTPYLTSINGHVAELPHRRRPSNPMSSSDFKVLTSKISSTGFRLASNDFITWANKMEALHSPTWRKAGIYEAIKASTYKIPKNPSLVLALVEKWCPETKSFIFPWGEATITLEDVMVLLGFSVLGSSVNTRLKSLEMRETMKKLEKIRVDNKTKDGQCDDDKIEHEAFLAAWLSDFVFPNARSVNILPMAVRLARGEKMALAPAVLASLYRDLTRIHGFVRFDESKKKIKLESLFKLVQVWIWERFKNISPKPREIGMGESRIARWSFRCEKNDERLSFDGFEWRPYGKFLKNWSHPKFYVEEGKWVSVGSDDEFVSFARCLRVCQIVGIGFVEDYYPNRVAMQFGFSQDLPGLVTDTSDFTAKEAWNGYNKSLNGSKMYIPSRLAITSVTTRYQDWWLKSVSEFLTKALPLCELLQKLGEGFPAKLKRRRRPRLQNNRRYNRACEGDYNITIAEMNKYRKKKGRDGKRSRREENNGNDSGLVQKHAEVSVRFDVEKGIGKICECGGSTSREMPLGELFQELAKRTSGHFRNKRAREDVDDTSMDCNDNTTIAEMNKSQEKTKRDASEPLGKRSRLEENSNGSRDEEIEPKIEEEEETGREAEKITVMIPFVTSSGGIVVSPQETRKDCDVNGINTKEKIMIDARTKEEELCSKFNKEEEEIDGRLRQRKLRIEEIALKLEVRVKKAEKCLVKIRAWKTR